VRDEIAQFKRLGVQPFGVNPASVESHVKYADRFKFGFPLLSDPDRAIARAYGVLKEDDRGIQRTVYGIGRDGVIRFAVRGAPPPADVLAALVP
jgi:thioredoxin-dependent peroxiredoxin